MMKVRLPVRDKLRQLGELGRSESRLHICRFQVISDVRIDVLVVVAARQRTQLPVKTLATGVVPARFAPAIATPVAKRLNQYL